MIIDIQTFLIPFWDLPTVIRKIISKKGTKKNPQDSASINNNRNVYPILIESYSICCENIGNIDIATKPNIISFDDLI
jgi:hypothetical protein